MQAFAYVTRSSARSCEWFPRKAIGFSAISESCCKICLELLGLILCTKVYTYQTGNLGFNWTFSNSTVKVLLDYRWLTSTKNTFGRWGKNPWRARVIDNRCNIFFLLMDMNLWLWRGTWGRQQKKASYEGPIQHLQKSLVHTALQTVTPASPSSATTDCQQSPVNLQH